MLNEKMIEISTLIANMLGISAGLVSVTDIRSQRDICQTAFDLLPETDSKLLCIELNTVDVSEEEVMSLDLGFRNVDIEYSDEMHDLYEMPAVEAWDRARLKPKLVVTIEKIEKVEKTEKKITLTLVTKCYSPYNKAIEINTQHTENNMTKKTLDELRMELLSWVGEDTMTYYMNADEEYLEFKIAQVEERCRETMTCPNYVG